MYEDIEREYKRKLNLKWAKSVYLLILLENIVVSIWCRASWIKQIIWLIITFSGTLLLVYIVVAYKMKLSNKLNIVSNVKQLIQAKQKKNGKNFFRILEDRDIKNEAQLQGIMEYYKLKIPQKTSGNIYATVWSVCITVFPILLTCLHFEENGALNMVVTSTLFSIAVVGIISFVAVLVAINIAKTLYIELFDKYDVSEKFVEMLSWKLVVLQRNTLNKKTKNKLL